MRPIFDITTIARWEGSPVGIVRFERELARRVHTSFGSALIFSFFDAASGQFHALPAAVADRIIAESLRIDDAAASKNTLPAARPRGVWPFRRAAAAPGQALPTAEADTIATQMDKVLGAPFAGVRPDVNTRPERQTIRQMSLRESGALPLDLDAGDVVISVGLDALFKPPSYVYALKQRHGFRYVGTCHDLIPLQLPHLVPVDFLPRVEGYFSDLFWTTDLVLTNSAQVERDLLGFCADNLVPAPLTARIRPGTSRPQKTQQPVLDIATGRFALYVSALEPRKNHHWLYDLWRRLREQSLLDPEFRLVIAGHAGSQVPDAIDMMQRDPLTAGSIRIIADVADEELAWLYQHARFCLHPSLAEGYGIPIADSLAAGKVCVCNLTEVTVEHFAAYTPCIPLADFARWEELIAALARDDALLASLTAKITGVYRPPTWDEAAQSLADAVGRLSG